MAEGCHTHLEGFSMQCVQSVCAAVSGSHCFGHCCCSCRLQALAVNAVVTHGFRYGDTTDSLNTTLCYVRMFQYMHNITHNPVKEQREVVTVTSMQCFLSGAQVWRLCVA